ncbi:MAG: hypothetical protein DRP87_12975 [Spirochaetes bacterium]|nr:MAG: hypothetical protein DRP87_12975 [Spirochaetota bacterium]
MIINVDAALNRMDGDRELFEELCRIFLSDYSHYFEEIDKAWKEQNSREIEKLGHKIKGAARNISAVEIAESAQKIEEIGRESRLEEIPLALENLKPVIEILKIIWKKMF